MSIKLKQNQKTQIPDSLQGQYAGFISRFLAYIIDIVIILLILVLVGGTIQLILTFFGLDDAVTQIEQSISLQGSILRFITAAWGIGLIAFLYFVLSWTVTSGKTLGNGLMGLRIVPMNGTRLTLMWAIWRYIAFWMSVLALGLGIFWILVSDKRQGWHDKMARTCVIYDWPARENEGAVQNLQNRWHYIKHARRNLRNKAKKSAAELDTGS